MKRKEEGDENTIREGADNKDSGGAASEQSTTDLHRGGEELSKLVAEKDTKIAELTADLQRTRADFENFRKQIEMQKATEKKVARYATVEKFLPLLDNIDRAIATYEELKPLAGTLTKTMKELELDRVSSEEGVEFNPDVHDAVMVEGDGEKEVVGETLRPGYYYEGEVLRPAMVRVKRV